MRTSVLFASIMATALFAGAASAQDRAPASLEFVHEPAGQEFTPPRLRIVRTDRSEQIAIDKNRMRRTVTCVASTGITATVYGAYGAAAVANCAQPTPDPIVDAAETLCAARVDGVYSYRDRIYTACLREELGTLGYTVLNLGDGAQVASYYGN